MTADVIIFGVMGLMAIGITSYLVCVLIGGIIHLFRGMP